MPDPQSTQNRSPAAPISPSSTSPGKDASAILWKRFVDEELARQHQLRAQLVVADPADPQAAPRQPGLNLTGALVRALSVSVLTVLVIIALVRAFTLFHMP